MPIVAAYCLRGELDGLHGGFMIDGVIMLLSSTATKLVPPSG